MNRADPRTCRLCSGVTGEDRGGGARQWVNCLRRDGTHEWMHLGCMSAHDLVGNPPKKWKGPTDA